MQPRPLIWTANGWEPMVFVCKHILRREARSAHTVVIAGPGYTENWDYVCDKCGRRQRYDNLQAVPMNTALELVKKIRPFVVDTATEDGDNQQT